MEFGKGAGLMARLKGIDMSIICAAIKGDKITIGSDSQTNFGNLNTNDDFLLQNKKIHRVNDSFIGLVGWNAASIILENLIDKSPELFSLNSRLNIFNTFNKIHHIMKRDYYLNTQEEPNQPVESSQLNAIIINKTGIYGISDYRDVTQYSRFWAIGSGGQIALGAMHAVYEKTKLSNEIVCIGIEAACEFDDSCALPLHFNIVAGAK